MVTHCGDLNENGLHRLRLIRSGIIRGVLGGSMSQGWALRFQMLKPGPIFLLPADPDVATSPELYLPCAAMLLTMD